MDSEKRVGQRPVARERVEKGRFELASSSCHVRDRRESREAESDDSRDMLRGESEVGVVDDACGGRSWKVSREGRQRSRSWMSSSSTKPVEPPPLFVFS